MTLPTISGILEEVRIASYNIFEGAQDTYELLKEFVSEQNIDVLCLQEANGWQEGNPSRLEDFATDTGLTYFEFGDSNTPCKLAIFSRLAIRASRLYTDRMWHCAIKALLEVEGVTLELWNVHLNPFDEDKRLAEVRFLAKTARHGIVVGDMNSLSRTDHYSNTLADDLLRQGNQRYGKNRLRYDVTDYYVRHGFVDAAARFGEPVNTFPARTDTEPNPNVMRLDYMFVPKPLEAAIDDIAVIKNGLTEKISDHYPVIMTFEPHKALRPLWRKRHSAARVLQAA